MLVVSELVHFHGSNQHYIKILSQIGVESSWKYNEISKFLQQAVIRQKHYSLVQTKFKSGSLHKAVCTNLCEKPEI